MVGPRPRGLAAVTAAPPASQAGRLVLGVMCGIAVAALLGAPVGAGNFLALKSGGQCTCGETLHGDAAMFIFVGAVEGAVSLLVGLPLWWGVNRLTGSGRAAALVTGLTLGAAPFVFLDVTALQYANVSLAVLLAGAGALGCATGLAVWITLWMVVGPRRVSRPADVFS